MGCKQSRTIKVQPIGISNTNDRGTLKVKEGTNANRKINETKDIIVDEYELDSDGKKIPMKRKIPLLQKGKSSLSLADHRSIDGDRGFSATSKASADSGLGEDDYAYGKDLGNIITEYSAEDDVRKVERSFIERDDLDLGITGVQLPNRHSAKLVDRQDESKILQSLREEGLIAKPTTESSGGVSFELVTNECFNTSGLPRPPPRQLAKLERRRKKRRVLTEEEIKEKLERADERRKIREEERLNKIKSLERSDATAALENFEHYKKEKEEQQIQKMDVVADNREKRINEIKEKIKERERRAEEVRRRKQKALEDRLDTTGISSNSLDNEITGGSLLTSQDWQRQQH